MEAIAASGRPALQGRSPALEEIPGPSAFGGSTRRFFELLGIVSVSDFRLRYANTLLGFLWTILRPLVFFGVIFMILRGVLRFGGNIENFPLILITGLIIYQYFAEATNRGVRSVSAREGIVRKMQFPRIIVPLSVSLTAAFTMLLNFAAVLPLFALFGVYPSLEWLLVIPLLVPLFALCTGLGLALSVVYVGFEDLGEMWGLISRMMLYLAPVLYPIEIVPERFQTLVTAANPLAPIIQQARVWIIGGDIQGPAEIAGFWLGVAVPATAIALIAALGLVVFVRRAPRVAEAL